MSNHIPEFVSLTGVVIVREKTAVDMPEPDVVRVYDEDGEVVLCLPAYIQDSEVKQILRQFNTVFSKGHRCGDAYRAHKIKSALCLLGDD